MNYQSLLGVLLPPVSYSPDQQMLSAELYAEGNSLGNANAAAELVKNAITPLYAETLLPDWERVLSITPASGATYQSRLNAVIAKLNEIGGLSIPYFISLAASIGYTIRIGEPQLFSAGFGCAGDRLYDDEIIWIWHVYTSGRNVQIYSFTAGQSYAGDWLTTFSDPILETVFNELKPAHTFVYFLYQES